MNISLHFFYSDHGYLQPLLEIEDISKEFKHFCKKFENSKYNISLKNSNLYLCPNNSKNHSTSPEMFDDFLYELEKQGFITTEKRPLLSNNYADQFLTLPHIGKEPAHYKHDLSYATHIYENYDIEQADFSDEIRFLTHQHENWRLYFKKLTLLADSYHAQKNPSANFLRTNLKREALKKTPLPFTPGEYTFMDFLRERIYRDDLSYTDPAQLRPIQDFINNNPQYQSLFLAASLWAVFGTEQRLGKTQIPDQRMPLRIFQHIHANNLLDGYFDNKSGIYNQQHSIYMTEIKDEKSRSTFIHELIHALANLIYDNYLELFPNDKEKEFAWQKISKDLLPQLFSMPLKDETRDALSKLTGFSSYQKRLWTQELAARWLQANYLSQNSELLINKESREFIENEFEIFIRNTQTRCKDIIEECGLYYLEPFRNSQFFQTQNKITLDKTACDLLQAAFTRQLTLVDLVIEKLLEEQQSAAYIINLLQDNHITEYAILLSAAKNGQLEIVNTLLEKFKIDFNDIRTVKAFNTAAKNGHLEIVKLFITAGINISSSHEQQLNALHYAAAKGHLDIVELLLQHKIDITTCDRDGNTALHWAAQNGHIDVLKFLANGHIDINTKNKTNNTPLHLAVKRGYFYAVRHLLANKAEINAINDDGNTPLHLAATNERGGIVELLLKNNCHVNVVNKAGCSALYLAVRNANNEIINTLLNSHGINVNLATVSDTTPLHLALASQQTDVALKLLNHPAIDIKFKNCWGDNALHTAASQNNLKVINAIVDLKKSNIDDLNRSGLTALHLAITNDQVDAAELLIQRGANINAEDVNGNSPLHIAVMENNYQAVELLLNIKSSEPIFTNAKNHEGNTVLHLATEKGHDVIVQLLLKNSGIHINEKTSAQQTPLHIALINNHMAIAELLINHPGIDINAVNISRSTALLYAIKLRRVAFAKLLIQSKQFKVDVNAQDYKGITPLHAAAQLDNEELVKTLLAHPEIDLQDKTKPSFWSTPPDRTSDSDDEYDDIEITPISLTYSSNRKSYS